MKTPHPIYLKDYTPSAFLIDEVFLNVELFEHYARIHSKLKVYKNPNHFNFSTVNEEKILKLNGKNLKTISVLKNQKNIAYEIEEVLDELILKIEFVENQAEIETCVEIYPQKNTELLGFYKSKNGYVTQCEAESFRAITWFLDRPDVMSFYSVRLEADKKQFPILLSNGNLENSGDLNSQRHFAFWVDPFKKPCYLFAMVFADLAVLQDSYRGIDLYIYAEKNKINECHIAMQALQKAMQWDEETFGLSCDLKRYSIVAVDDFNMGAMENKGLNIFNSKFVLASEQTATDTDIENVDDVIAHEYFHNWTGNRITCRDWFQLSLKEGLTVFREQLFSSDVHDVHLSRIKEVRLLKNVQFPEDSSPMAHPVRPQSYLAINNFYTATVYEKGAELIRMIYTLIGKEKFKEGLKEYFRLFDGTAATIEDFIFAMQKVSDVDFSPFMPWYETPGTPEVVLETQFDEENKTFSLLLKQNNPHNLHPVLMPINVALFEQNGKKIIEKTLHFQKQTQAFLFKNISQKPILSFLRNFSAPVKIKMPFCVEDAIFILKNEDDAFSAFQAAQMLFEKNILENQTLSDDFLNTLRHFLSYFKKNTNQNTQNNQKNNPNNTAGFLAEILTLPSLAHLVNLFEKEEKIDIVQLHAQREKIIQQMAIVLENDFVDVYENLNQQKNLSHGERALKNKVLQFLVELEKSEHLQRLILAFDSAQNMTDSVAALNCFANLKTHFEQCHFALEKFYQQHQNNDLILCKWFATQAASRGADCLENVQKLSRHSAFSLENPNKVYALIRVFAANLLHFHGTIGAYDFVAEQILRLNDKNPSVAARLLRSFDDFQKFSHANLANSALAKLEQAPLSRDVFEVLKKIKI